jgi:nucleoid-associated protein YgaU
VAGDADRIRLTVAAPDDEVRLTRADAVDPEVTPAPEAEVRLTRADADLRAAPLPLGLLGATAETGDADQATDEVVMRRVAEGTGPAVHAVAAGESFWTIARDALTSAGERPDDARIHGYWQRLVDHNREVLDDPDNPDLLFPGQVLELPPLDADEGRA